MKCILILSQERQHPDAAQWCLDRLHTDADSLSVYYILDEEFSRRFESMLAESTFVADKPGDDLTQALNTEYKRRAEKVLQDIAKLATQKNIAVKTEILEGSYLDVVEALDREQKPDVIVATERNPGWIKRLLGRRESVEIKKMIKSELKIF